MIAPACRFPSNDHAWFKGKLHRMPRSRLWCVFELAVFRMANPNGKISLVPMVMVKLAASRLLCTH